MTATVRPALPSDRQFVLSGWSSSFRRSRYAGIISMETWADVMHPEITRILDHPSTSTLVAEEPGETDERGAPWLYGFIAFRGSARTRRPYVYYTYVKSPYREARRRLGEPQGVATLLLAAAGIDPRRRFEYACETASALSLAAAGKIPLAECNPFPARYLHQEQPHERTSEAVDRRAPARREQA